MWITCSWFFRFPSIMIIPNSFSSYGLFGPLGPGMKFFYSCSICTLFLALRTSFVTHCHPTRPKKKEKVFNFSINDIWLREICYCGENIAENQFFFVDCHLTLFLYCNYSLMFSCILFLKNDVSLLSSVIHELMIPFIPLTNIFCFQIGFLPLIFLTIFLRAVLFKQMKTDTVSWHHIKYSPNVYWCWKVCLQNISVILILHQSDGAERETPKMGQRDRGLWYDRYLIFKQII